MRGSADRAVAGVDSNQHTRDASDINTSITSMGQQALVTAVSVCTIKVKRRAAQPGTAPLNYH